MEFRYETRRLANYRPLSDNFAWDTDLSIICLERGQRLFLSTPRVRSTSASRETMRAIVACNSSRITGGSGYKEEGTIRLEL